MTGISFDAIDNHPADAVRFFKIMMRLEYALKACGFAAMDRNNRYVSVQWDDFVRDRVDREFFEKIRDSGMANTLINSPPSLQILDTSGVLTFSNAAVVTTPQLLVGAVQRVRNNLFHGGKSGDPDHERNDTLIADAIAVITELLLANDDLRWEFEGRY